RPFHAHISATSFYWHAGVPPGLLNQIGQLGANWMSKADVHDDPVAEKRRYPRFRAIVELIWQNDIHGLQLFLQRADRACRQNPFRTEFFEAVDVRSKIQF